MKLGRCPACHAHISLEAVAADDAARELLMLLAAQDAAVGRALLAYLGLFRPAAQDLRWDRALRLAREVLAFEADAQRLCAGLEATADAIRAKAGGTPLRNHNYLRRVLEQLPAQPAQPAAAVLPAPARALRGTGGTSKTAAAINALLSGIPDES